MKTTRLFILLPILLLTNCTTPDDAPLLNFELRVQEAADGDAWEAQTEPASWKPQETAVLITDMWDQHWCEGAETRVGEMAPRMNEVIKAARAQGITIVHSPSSVISYYTEHPARKRVADFPASTPPEPFLDWYHLDNEKEPNLPIDDSDGGCDTCPDGKPCDNVHDPVWTRQVAAIEIADNDLISDSGPEIYNAFQALGIKNVIVMGVHTNMCVLGRPFGIRSQKRMGMNVVLARDLTDAMYNPQMPPYVTQVEGTALVIDHVEKHWAPTLLSTDLLAAMHEVDTVAEAGR